MLSIFLPAQLDAVNIHTSNAETDGLARLSLPYYNNANPSCLSLDYSVTQNVLELIELPYLAMVLNGSNNIWSAPAEIAPPSGGSSLRKAFLTLPAGAYSMAITAPQGGGYKYTALITNVGIGYGVTCPPLSK